MRNELKLITAFLVLNFSVVALAIAGYQKSGMRLGAVLSHLTT
ncbi:putative conserved membrane protein [Synechococcus sp. A15-28]|nr:putative conserved membrane protein [Synechococcus sp. A15-28]